MGAACQDSLGVFCREWELCPDSVLALVVGRAALGVRTARVVHLANLPRATLGSVTIATNDTGGVDGSTGIDQCIVGGCTARSGEELAGSLVFGLDIGGNSDMAGFRDNLSLARYSVSPLPISPAWGSREANVREAQGHYGSDDQKKQSATRLRYFKARMV